MTSRSPSAPTLRMRKQARGRSRPPIQIVVAVFVTLLILFLWMQFLVAQESESLGREIVETTQELERTERDNAALENAISELLSQEYMAGRAEVMGYVLQSPVYILFPEPLAPPADEQTELESSRSTVTSDEASRTLFGAVAHTLDMSPEMASEP